MIELRDYQTESVNALFAYFDRARGNPLLVLPTGSGKSLVLAAFIKQALERFPQTRVLVVTHRKELIEQDTLAIKRYWPEAPVGVYSAGLGRRDIARVTVAGVQSIAKKAAQLGHVDLMIVDEAHLIPFDGDGQYQTLIKALRAKNPKLKILGLTATPFRLSGGMLTRGPKKIFTSVCHDVKVERLVAEGWLSPLVSPETSAEYDTKNVKEDRGDYTQAGLQAMVDSQDVITRAALDEAITLAADRRARLVFCVSVDHARRCQAYLKEKGEHAEVVTGEDDALTRSSRISRFRNGQVRWLCSVDVITTGFDAPVTDCIVLLRPTQSAGLYVQIVGRGMRLNEGKGDCLVLDYGGNVARHGPITAVTPKSQKEGEKLKDKICPRCFAEVAIHKRECPECGYAFPAQPRDIDHETKAARQNIMSSQPTEWHDVAEVRAQEWIKPDKPTSVCVEYRRAMTPIAREWVCPEHGGYATEKFRAWWKNRGGKMPCPETATDCVMRFHELDEVVSIEIAREGEYLRVRRARVKQKVVVEEVREAQDQSVVDEIWGQS